MRSIFVLALLVGCSKSDDSNTDTGSSDSGSSDSGSSDSGDTQVEDILPLTGAWAIGDVTVIDDGCSIDDGEGGGEGEEEGQLTVTDNGDGTYNVLAAEFLGPWVCTPEGAVMSCIEQSFEQDLNNNGLDAVVAQTFPFGMVLSDEANALIDYSVDMACVGSDCGNLEQSFPCSSIFTATAAHVADQRGPE